MKGIIFQQTICESAFAHIHDEFQVCTRLAVPEAGICLSVYEGKTSAFTFTETDLRKALSENRSPTCTIDVPEKLVDIAKEFIIRRAAFTGALLEFWKVNENLLGEVS